MIESLKIAVIGLGYAGLPVAVAFGKKYSVIGFDIKPSRIQALQEGIDVTNEINSEELKRTNIVFTNDPARLREAGFIIVAVPTPIDQYNQSDLLPLLNASKIIGENIKKGAVVVYESTVYPGTTEEQCIPALEDYSKLEAGKEFFVGYSPTRINPGDKKYTFTKIKKVVAGQDPEVLNFIASVYGSVIEAGVYKAKSIRVAEAAKVIEITQREVNVELMNEFALICHELGIDTGEVLETAGTKWNFLNFTPGLAGGHCNGVSPYYLEHKVKAPGHYPEVILSGSRINDGIGRFIGQKLVKKLIQHDITVPGAKVTVLGLAYKENISDIRNSKVLDVITELLEYGIDVQVSDPYADSEDSESRYGITLIPQNELQPASAVIVAVKHKEYIQAGWKQFDKLLMNKKGIVFDIKSILDQAVKPAQIDLWRL